MIRFDNHFEFSNSELGINEPRDINLISHAHTDHIPSKYKDRLTVCSDITLKMIQFRNKMRNAELYSSKSIESFDAGHILGSKMFRVNKNLLYTGDFNTQNSFCGKAVPVKCSTLIIECTYGNPKYEFPSREEIIRQLKEYIDEHEKVIITTLDSGFGKPQEICSILTKLRVDFKTNDRVKNINNMLGLKFRPQRNDATVVLANNPEAMFYPGDYKRVVLTGWALTRNGGYPQGVSMGFPFSSHADYPALIEFVKKCRPEKVYTQHGYASQFARDLRELGYDAEPLVPLHARGFQSRIIDFFR